jgi:hypothetical protein
MVDDYVSTVSNVRRHAGIAGQFSVSADITDEWGTVTLTFVGSTYGGPVVMVLPPGIETFVSNPGRFGDFGEEWVRRFLA